MERLPRTIKYTFVIATIFVLASQATFARYYFTAYAGAARPVRFLRQAQAGPLALASEDMDEDGLPDLVGECAGPFGNVLTLRRGGGGPAYPNNSSPAPPFLSVG